MVLSSRLPKNIFSSTRWRTRAIIWIAAAIAGLTAVVFAELSNVALHAFSAMTQDRLWVTLLLTPSMGMVVV